MYQGQPFYHYYQIYFTLRFKFKNKMRKIIGNMGRVTEIKGHKEMTFVSHKNFTREKYMTSNIGRLGDFMKEFCEPQLIQHVLCKEVCKTMSKDAGCFDRCVEAASLVHSLRERICQVFVGTADGSPPQNCPQTCALARSFIQFQSGIVLTISYRAMYRAWHTSTKISEFMAKSALPVLGVTIGLSGMAVSLLV